MSAGGFGLAHLPYGVFRRAGEPARVGVRFEDGVLDLAALAADGLLDHPEGAFAQHALNAFMAQGPAAWAATRERVTRVLSGVDAEPPLLALDDVERQQRRFGVDAREETRDALARRRPRRGALRHERVQRGLREDPLPVVEEIGRAHV